MRASVILFEKSRASFELEKWIEQHQIQLPLVMKVHSNKCTVWKRWSEGGQKNCGTEKISGNIFGSKVAQLVSCVEKTTKPNGARLFFLHQVWKLRQVFQW